MDVRLLASKVIQTLRQEGFWAVLGKGARSLKRSGFHEHDNFDLTYGTDTGGIEPLWKFTIQSPNARFGTRYEPTQESELVCAVGFLCEELKTFTFVDLGCGKGRAVVIAASLGFRKLIGVEFVSELVEVARNNLAKLKIENAVVLHADAADFCFPNSNTVVYLYNPFSPEVFKSVILNLKKSFVNKLYVIYKAPRYGEMLDASGFLKRCESPPRAPHMRIWTLTP